MKYDIKNIKLECWGGPTFRHPKNVGGFVLRWACDGIGFGEITFVIDKDNKVICETEHMNKEFVDAVLNKFLNEHVIYNKV